MMKQRWFFFIFYFRMSEKGEPHSGQCLCGSFRFHLYGALVSMNCHCSMCRKNTGSTFSSCLLAEKANFKILEKGADTPYQSSDRGIRHFCKNCGCSLYDEIFDFPDNTAVYTATLDDESQKEVQVLFESFTNYKAAWHRLYQGVPHSKEEELLVQMAQDMIVKK